MFVVGSEQESIEKSTHDYIKRTGTPGNYKYWYKLPNGEIASHEDEDHEGARKEHVRRLIAGRMRNVHNMTDQEIASNTGMEKTKVGQHVRNMRRPGATAHEQYSENELHEAKHSDVSNEEYQRRINQTEEQAGGESSGRAAPRARTQRTRSSSSRERQRASGERGEEQSTSTSSDGETSASSGGAQTSERNKPAESPEQQRERERTQKIAEKRRQLKDLFGLDLGSEEDKVVASAPFVDKSGDQIWKSESEPMTEDDIVDEIIKSSTSNQFDDIPIEQSIELRRSVELVVDRCISPVKFEKHLSIEDKIKKSDIISRIKKIKKKNKTAMGVRG